MYDDLLKLIERLNEFEYELAKQNVMSDKLDALKLQKEEFNGLNKAFSRILPSMNELMARAQEIISADSSNNQIKSLYEECNSKLNLVS